MKRIEDYLHLYLGSEVELIGWFPKNEAEKILSGVEIGGVSYQASIAFYYPNYTDCTRSEYHQLPMKDIKPILRPLSDMSEEEMSILAIKSEIYVFSDFKDEVDTAKNYLQNDEFKPEQFAFLLSKHFDLFGLIEAGLAIDKTSLKP